MKGALLNGLGILLNGTPNLQTSAHMTFLNVAAPNVIAACTSEGQVALNLINPNLTTTQQQSIASYCPTSP